MAIDPTEPETVYDDETNGDNSSGAGSSGGEVPEADAAEQQQDVRPERDDPQPHIDKDRSNEADAIEQARVVALDEDDYR
ncbi:hypothetical protein [Streptomyces albipurpureus]|uniref:Uncharacterized protein n=1 Tax=Streptomyces albipurpureus TaxID=2897419 RepID=A0ABT0UKU3_9ACTN|nr:hypothetical protein [Streptomyces sp. CWNU-1]MCM2389054.1 hypothetical protein [Streptomyces sp. CWNU-1]